MAEISEMKELIQGRSQIIYDVCDPKNSAKHVRGERIGNPYIVFETKNGHTMVHIYQIDGVTTSDTRGVPSWGTYHLSHIIIIRKNGNFEPNEPTFNPDSAMYENTICKV